MNSTRQEDVVAAMSPRAWLAAGGLVALYLVLTWLQHVPAVTTRNDGAVYILLSREIGLPWIAWIASFAFQRAKSLVLMLFRAKNPAIQL